VQLNLRPSQVIRGCTNSACTVLNFDVDVAAYPDQLSDSCTGFDAPGSDPTRMFGCVCGTWPALCAEAVPDIAISATAATASAPRRRPRPRGSPSPTDVTSPSLLFGVANRTPIPARARP